jgi:hypothetical protein
MPEKSGGLLNPLKNNKMESLDYTLEDEVIDLEWCAKNGHKPPKGRKYRIIIDRDKYVVEKECMTGKELLLLANMTPPERFQLRQKLKHGNVVTIAYDQKVCFTEPGIEKFKTLPLDQTEGEVPRRDFILLEEDEIYLNNLGLVWEAANIQGALWIFINDYMLPEGYNANKATLGIRMTPGYPTAQLDMIYFNPALSRADGQTIGALSLTQIDGKIFQQWSRHRTGTNPWRPDVDNLSTHVPLADAWLLLEFEKKPTNAVPA